jgi:prepilin-type N-terminal cleavage/methylation domain-containing protein
MRRGFTLIEVLVTMTIISILAGMMIPSVWKFWESQEVQTTKERLNVLKIAMIGDKNLIQNGNRTSYGFVGDYGELPIQGQLSTASLRAYIPGGYNADTYNDAWGRRFRYTAYDNLPGYEGRFLSGQLCSDGLDGITGNADDICITLNSAEVAPTDRLKGQFSFTNITGTYYTRFEVRFKIPGGTLATIPQTGCKKIGVTSKIKDTPSFTPYTTIVKSSNNPVLVPIGSTTFNSLIFRDSNCTNLVTRKEEITILNVNGIQSWLPVDLPAFEVSLP